MASMPPFLHGKVDSMKVFGYISSALTRAAMSGAAVTPNELMRVAFRDLQMQRWDAANATNLELGCAEHYMFARWIAGKTGDAFMMDGPDWYDTYKKMAKRIGVEKYVRKSDNPTLPPGPELIAWGKLGAQEGLNDFREWHPGHEGVQGAAAGIMLESVIKMLRDNIAKQFE
jgi:hypothetical protein